VRMPPPGAGKQSNRNEQVQETEHQLAGLENQYDQYDSGQPGSSCGQVMSAEVAKKLFDFIEVHILRGSSGRLVIIAGEGPRHGGWSLNSHQKGKQTHESYLPGRAGCPQRLDSRFHRAPRCAILDCQLIATSTAWAALFLKRRVTVTTTTLAAAAESDLQMRRSNTSSR